MHLSEMLASMSGLRIHCNELLTHQRSQNMLCLLDYQIALCSHKQPQDLDRDRQNAPLCRCEVAEVVMHPALTIECAEVLFNLNCKKPQDENCMRLTSCSMCYLKPVEQLYDDRFIALLR